MGGIHDIQGYSVRFCHELGSERGASHSTQHHARHSLLGEVVAKRNYVVHQREHLLGARHPPQSDGCFRFGVWSPEGGVTGSQTRRGLHLD